MENFLDYDFVEALIAIIFIDLTLSGDNAIIIALACRSLPPATRELGMIFGTATAIVLRIFFTAVISFFLKIPLIKLIGGILLIYIAIKFLTDDDDDVSIDPQKNLFNAIKVIAYADVVMSLDNVITVAAIADGSILLLVIGLLFSMLFIFYGSSIISKFMDKFPFLIWVGGGLIGWIGGSIAASDPLIVKWLGPEFVDLPIYAPVLSTIIVLSLAKIINHNSNLDAQEHQSEAEPANFSGPLLVATLMEADHYEA